MNNILFCSAGRRARLLLNAKDSIGNSGNIIATDNSSTAPALYCADKAYTVSRIDSPNYINEIIEICKNDNVKAITTLIDPEISILGNYQEKFKDLGILPLCPSKDSAIYCFNKFELYKYLKEKGIKTPLTFHSYNKFEIALENNEINFPVFIKPICGSGSVGTQRINDINELKSKLKAAEHDYIIQEYMNYGDCDADVYVDCITHKAVSIFAKRKIETRIGGACKTISFKDEKLFKFIEEIVSHFEFNGPLDMDFFIKDGEYYLSEINPRFGGAYLHAYGAGVDFFKLIRNNINGITNDAEIGLYQDGIVMLMYDDVIITHKDELVDCNFSVM